MINYKYRLLIKLIVIWLLINIYPITNQLNPLTAYKINEIKFSIPNVIFYSTIAYLITLFIFWLINKISFNNFGRKVLLITGVIPIILPVICYIIKDGLGTFIYMLLAIVAIISGVIIYFFQKTKTHFIKGLLIYLSQFLGLYLIIIIWESITNINFEIILSVGLATLFLSNLILLNELKIDKKNFF
ncbi:hypothetical protein [Clostridium lundense]|uniref:hypothetical protein n=1 Tax=Clostridium lundense TaxID=319475 RepID=UPI000481FC96|nr:hypothetical protein [Clostridium lundense]